VPKAQQQKKQTVSAQDAGKKNTEKCEKTTEKPQGKIFLFVKKNFGFLFSNNVFP
jgi:hypothetical protein